MYEIVLTTWYQNHGNDEEVYNGLGFKTISDACEYLGKNYETIFENYPVEAVAIKYNIKREHENKK